jgi:hypothetical protein
METVNKVKSLIVGEFYASTSPHRDPDHVHFEFEHADSGDDDFMTLSIAQARALRDWLDKALPVSAGADHG